MDFLKHINVALYDRISIFKPFDSNTLVMIFKLITSSSLIFESGAEPFDSSELLGPISILVFIGIALWMNRSSNFKGYSFSFMVLAAVTTALNYPIYFVQLGSFEMKLLIVPLLQIIMFGMGTTLSLQDFYGVLRMPKGVLVGVICQFTIMPILGFGIATLFGFPPEIAAGIILIGSSPSGLASNVMSYLAKANVALSVTLTTVATLTAPLMTPLLMKFLAGSLIPIDTFGMMISILKMVILPVLLGLIVHHVFKSQSEFLDRVLPKVSMAAITFIIVIITAAGSDNLRSMGLILVAAAILHNALGYFLGYWSGRLVGMQEKDCRTIALEVGMQNGGLASGIAMEMGKISTLGLAAVVFGPWMNISGSVLASWWRTKPLAER